MAEIHTTISDFQFTYTPVDGYTLRLEKASQKDGAGYYVYRVVCDMAAITETTSSNENVKLDIPYTLIGTYMAAGKTEIKEMKQSVSLQRFLVPDQEAENKFFSNYWYLSEYDEDSNNDWVNFTSADSYTTVENLTQDYTLANSPIKDMADYLVSSYINEKGETIYDYQLEESWKCEVSLPGWVEGKKFNYGLQDTRLVFEGYPLDYGCSVYLVTDQVMLCMKAVYSESGELQDIYRYKFTRFEPEKPALPGN